MRGIADVGHIQMEMVNESCRPCGSSARQRLLSLPNDWVHFGAESLIRMFLIFMIAVDRAAPRFDASISLMTFYSIVFRISFALFVEQRSQFQTKQR